MIFLSSIVFAINPKQIENMRVKIVQKGSIIADGIVIKAELMMYIPQENVVDIEVFSEQDYEWNYIFDEYRNKMVKLIWYSPKGTIKYRIETVVDNKAKHFPNKTLSVGHNETFLKQTDVIVFSPEIKKMAFPYDRSLSNVVNLTKFVHDYITYDISRFEQRVPADEVLRNRRGVCSDYAILLLSLLRASGIPSRYIGGYAFSNVQNEIIGHAWVEVLFQAEGKDIWLPFDPTWLESGFLDATHIKTANLQNANQSETLTYLGGSVYWVKEKDEFQILSLSQRPKRDISLEGDVKNGHGYIKASLKGECSFANLRLVSCVDEEKNKLFDIYDPEREVWFCNAADVYWVFNATKGNYICPVVVYDETGQMITKNIEVKELEYESPEIILEGPDEVSTNQKFDLKVVSPDDFILFSPNLTWNKDRIWSLNLKKPGRYRFYLYSEGALYEKIVDVFEKRLFDLNILSPKNVTIESHFNVNISITNLMGVDKNITLILEFEDNELREDIMLSAFGNVNRTFNLTAKKSGTSEIVASVFGDSLVTKSNIIEVYEQKNILSHIQKFVNRIMFLILGIFEA
jgi:hypothetical protein